MSCHFLKKEISEGGRLQQVKGTVQYIKGLNQCLLTICIEQVLRNILKHQKAETSGQAEQPSQYYNGMLEEELEKVVPCFQEIFVTIQISMS